MKKTIKILIILATMLFSLNAFGAEDDSIATLKTINYLFLAVMGFILLMVMSHWANKTPVDSIFAVEKPGKIKKILSALTRAIPISKEQDIMLNHEYDGIKELNNSVPPWLNYIFIGSVIFSVFYLFHFHVFGTGKSQLEEYSAEMEIARLDMERLMESGAFITEENVIALTDPESIGAGKERFAKDCSPCHGMNGEGTIGPNLTDDYWIHGGKVGDLFHTVKAGVPEKGMVAWGQQLNPKQMQEVVSYILTLRGTKPPNGKVPEGKLFVPQDSILIKDSADTNADTLNK